MEVFDAVRTVLAVRKFQDKPVPEEIVRQIVLAIRLRRSVRARRSASLSERWLIVNGGANRLSKELHQYCE